MANPNEDRYDRTFDAVEHSAAQRRAEKMRMKKISLLVVFCLLALVLLSLLILIIGSIAGSIPSGSEKETDGIAATDKITWGSVSVTAEDVKKGSLILSNDTHSYDLPDTDGSLAKIYDFRATAHTGTKPYQLAGLSTYMNADALTALDKFLTDCAAANNYNNVLLRMAFLTTEERSTYASSIREHASDYLTGYGCDLRLKGDSATYALSSNDTINSWLLENAAKYGFVVRYPADKVEFTGVADYTNYFRYVGVAHATYMKENNLCLEEYIQQLQQYTSKKRLTVTGADGKVYDIYYAAVNGTTSVSCPTNYAYTVSGTNAGGVVVTIDRSATNMPIESDTGTADTTVATTAP